MKARALLVCSAALNVLLVGALAWWIKLGHVESGRKMAEDHHTPAGTSLVLTPQAAGVYNWAQLESTNYLVYIANLRSMGCPEETVQDLIAAEINKIYWPKIAAAQRRPAVRGHYWQPQPSWSASAYSEQNQLLKERSAVLKALVGIDFDEYNRRSNPPVPDDDDPYAFLSHEKQRQLEALQSKYREAEAQVYANARGLITEEDRAAVAALRKEEAAEMDALLTPSERLEHDLRDSPASRRLQQDLEFFNPSEPEFRAVYQAQAALYDRTEQANSIADPDSRREALKAAEAQFDQQLQASLGDQRYAEYQRAKDPCYQTLVKVAGRFGLPGDAVNQAMDVRQAAEAERQQVLGNSGLDAQARAASLRNLYDQTSASLAAVLGEKGFAAYRDYDRAWLERMVR